MKTVNSFAEWIGKLLFIGIAMFVGIGVSGWAISICWEWFIGPVFHLPPISIAQGIGLSIFAIALRPSKSKDKEKDYSVFKTVFLSCAEGTINMLLLLFMGWVVTLFL